MRFRSGFRRWAGAALVALIASALLSACDRSPSTMQPSGPIAASELDSAWMVFIISAIIFVGVTSVLLVAVFRFRARPGGPEARQVHGNTTIEIVWTIAPTIVLFVILAITIGKMFSLAQPANANPVTVKVIGHQWWWEFQYPNDKIVVADELHIPVGQVVHLDLVSDNVIHSVWVPELAGKTDVIPGHNNTMWIKADKAGSYRGECTEFCGTQHAHMDFVVIAMAPSDYQSWVTAQQSTALTPATGSTEAQGMQVFQKAGCVACHNIDGVTKAGVNKIGPNLTHFGGRTLIAGGVLDNNPQNLATWIRDAQGVKQGSDMPSFGTDKISQSDLDALVAYLTSLK